MKDLYCPIIHGALQLNLKNNNDEIYINHCCLRRDLVKVGKDNIWNNPVLLPLREINKTNLWAKGCENCESLENANMISFRSGSLIKFDKKYDLSGPRRLDLMFDISCNLACRTCGPNVSTYWQKHLSEHEVNYNPIKFLSRHEELIEILKTLDLSNLEFVVFCGGETLLGSGYWQVVESLIELVPNCKKQLTINFQTNGTQPIPEKYYQLIEKVQLVKLNISLDAIEDQFEYLRWPAKWKQVTDNITKIKNSAPENVMFLIEETISVFNLAYLSTLESWVQENFSENRFGHIVNHTRHLALGIYSLNNLTNRYVDYINTNTQYGSLIHTTWQEKPIKIKEMLEQIKIYDDYRMQNCFSVFPLLEDFYKDYI
jgi:sulfatase maturation enzyme AslB (radical SAM superfamily)